LDQNIIWIGTDDGNVQLTKDGGKTWTNLTLNIKGVPVNTWCYHIEASAFDKSTAYAVFDGHSRNDKNTYVYKTTDNGLTWKSIVTTEVKGFARNIQEDLKNPDLLFLGTEFGLYITNDGGKSWYKFTNGVPAAAVHYIEMHPKTNDLILGTHGRGIIIIDDISPLRELTPEVMAEPLHFFTTKPVYMDETSTFGGSSTETQFIGSNPSSQAKIIYHLPKRHTFGKMTLDIYDEKGTWITTISPGKQKGINIVEWGYNSMAPKVAAGKTIDGAAMFSPRVPAGKYKAVITKGSEKFETMLELRYPENSVYNLAERKLQEETTKKLYDMSENLAYMVYEIDELIAHTDKVMLENAALKKQALKLNTDLNKLKDGLVITKGDNYVGAGEKQLREKIGDLYSTIGSYYGAPSQSQLENLDLLNSSLEENKKKYTLIKETQLSKYKAATEKAGIKYIELKAFEEFVKKN
jgi:regulator of replication initiation timing